MPPELLPVCGGRGLPGCKSSAAIAVVKRSLSPTALACRNVIIQSAKRYKPASIDAVPTGRSKRLKGGGELTSLMVQIVYAYSGGEDVREAEIQCQVNDEKKVVALLH